MVAITKVPAKKAPKRTRPAKATAASSKVVGTATAHDAPAPANGKATKAKPKAEPSKRAKLFDASPCAVIRWCRAQGWEFAQVRKSFDGVGLSHVSDTTIRCQLAPKRAGDPAELSKDQIKQLTAAAK
jgi:hypothetical protein